MLPEDQSLESSSSRLVASRSVPGIKPPGTLLARSLRDPKLRADVAVGVVVVMAFAFGRSFESNALLLVNLMVYMMLAQGVNVSYGFTGYLPFGFVGFFGAGAYGMAVSTSKLHVGAYLGVAFGVGASVLVALALSPLLRLRGSYFAIASLAAAEALVLVVSNPSMQGLTNGAYGANLSSVFSPGSSYVFTVLALGIVTAVVIWLRHFAFGLALRAIRADHASAAMAGINVVRLRTTAWVIAAAMAGLAGSCYAWVISVFYPGDVFNLSTSVFAIIFALFGGIGTVVGPIIGTIVLYGFYNAIGISVPQYFQLIYGLLIVFIVMFIPRGLTSLRPWRLMRLLSKPSVGSMSPSGDSIAPSGNEEDQHSQADQDDHGVVGSEVKR